MAKTKTNPEDIPPHIAERIARAKAAAEAQERERVRERHTGAKHEVKEFIDSIRLFEKAIKAAAEAIEYNRFSPEAIQYLINKLEKITNTINGIIAKFRDHAAQVNQQERATNEGN